MPYKSTEGLKGAKPLCAGFGSLKRNNLGQFILIALSITFVYFIRSIGMAFVLACLGYFLIKHRWRELILLGIIAGFFVIAWQVYNAKAGATSSYFQQFLQKNPYEPELGNITFREYLNRFFTNFKLYSFFVIPQILLPPITNLFWQNLFGFAFLFFLVIGLSKTLKTKNLGIWEINILKLNNKKKAIRHTTILKRAKSI